MSHYYPGRGLPPYLLSRNYETSSTDSNGASRIFASSSCSTTSDTETDASSILSLPRTFSYMSTSSSFTWPDTTSISTAPSTFEYSTSSAERSIDDEVRTLRSETLSMGKESTPNSYSTSFANRSSHLSIEKTISNNSFMNDVYTSVVCLTKSYDHNVSFDDSYGYNAPACNDPETMLPSYVSIFPVTEDEQQHAKDRSSSLYYCKISTAIFIDYFQPTWLWMSWKHRLAPCAVL